MHSWLKPFWRTDNTALAALPSEAAVLALQLALKRPKRLHNPRISAIISHWRLSLTVMEFVMRSPLFVTAAVLTLFATTASAQTLQATSNMLLRVTDRSLDFTSDTTTSIRDSKVVLAAHDDAASFVATNGAIRGAQLEAAFSALRTQLPAARNASDQELAAAILAP
jgi:uncharacterized protein (TIGR02448 family)